MQQYLDMLSEVLTKGNKRGDRTGTGTYSLFGRQFRHNLQDSFPILTTKKIHWKSVAHELLWMISGSTNVKDLQANGVTIWDEWADEDGELGPVYGKQWRSWEGLGKEHWHFDEELEVAGKNPNAFEVHEPTYTDQLLNVIKRIKTNPEDRRLIVSAWNVGDISKMALPPCHMFFQFYVDKREDQYGTSYQHLSCHMYQRSADIFLGVPFNIASYALFTHIVAHCCDMRVGDLIISYGDLHLYQNHVEQALEQLRRKPAESLPRFNMMPNHTGGPVITKDIDKIRFEDFVLHNYSHPMAAIKAPVAV